MNRIKKAFPHAVRNCLIYLAVIFCLIKSADVYLTVSDKKKDAVIAGFAQEAHRIVTMNVEKTDIADYACVATSASTVDYVRKSDSDSAFIVSEYPLTRDMNEEALYDNQTKNIVFIGDSFVWGQGSINRNELFWQLLEEDLRSAGYNVRVHCAAMGGANAYEEISWLTDTTLVEDLDADMVIFGYMYNDAVPLHTEKVVLLDDDMSQIFRFLKPLEKIFPSFVTHIRYLGVAEAPLEKKDGIRYYFDGITPLTGSTKTEYVENFVIPLSEFAKTSDIPVAVMTLPNEPKSPLLKRLYKPLKGIYAAYDDIAFYDCFKEYSYGFASAKHKDNYQVNPADGHPGSATNRFFADYIKKFLIKDYADVLGEPSSGIRMASGIRINDCTPYSLGLNEISREDTYAEYTFAYPSETKRYDWYGIEFDKYFLANPIGEDYVKLCFDVPVSITSIELNGEKLESASVYFTCINEKLNYDDHSCFSAENTGTGHWTGFGNARVTSLCIHADMADRNGGKLTLKINTAGEEK